MAITVLIADDEKIVNDLVRLFFERSGFHVLSAFNGIEAVDLVKSDKPGFLILDIGLPDLDGIDVIKEVKNISPGTKIIVTTGYRNDELEEKVLEMGVAKYLKKPFAVKELVDEVNKIVVNS